MRVALRKESVDRNVQSVERPPGYYVALRKESVDRNINNPQIDKHDGMSLSARRAWIEMWQNKPMRPLLSVALRKESVDRNTPMAG